jgi:hypothetical protein
MAGVNENVGKVGSGAPKVGRPLFWSAGPLVRCPADYRKVSGQADWKK